MFTKKFIQKALSTFGYSLAKVHKSPYAVQRDLITDNMPVIFDIGAHTGEVAKIYRNNFPLADIYCFEPFPQSFQILSKNLTGFPNIFCFELAVSDKKGTALLNTNIHSATNSLFATDERGSSFWGAGLLDTTAQVDVCTTKVDIFCLEKGISHIDILKMDVQGAEYSVLVGAQEMLSNHKIFLIYSEILMCPTYQGQHKLHEYLSFLDSLGYDFLDFFNPVRYHNQLIQVDAIFLCSSYTKKIEKETKGAAADAI